MIVCVAGQMLWADDGEEWQRAEEQSAGREMQKYEEDHEADVGNAGPPEDREAEKGGGISRAPGPSEDRSADRGDRPVSGSPLRDDRTADRGNPLEKAAPPDEDRSADEGSSY